MTSSRKISTRFETPDKSPGFLLWQVTNVWQRRMKKALRETGLTHVQFVLLVSTVWLNNHGENATQVAGSELVLSKPDRTIELEKEKKDRKKIVDHALVVTFRETEGMIAVITLFFASTIDKYFS